MFRSLKKVSLTTGIAVALGVSIQLPASAQVAAAETANSNSANINAGASTAGKSTTKPRPAAKSGLLQSKFVASSSPLEDVPDGTNSSHFKAQQPVLDTSPKQIAIAPQGKPAQPSTPFQNQPLFGGSQSATPVQPALRGPTTLTPVTVPQTPLRKLRIDMDAAEPTGQRETKPSDAEQEVKTTLEGVTPLRLREVLNEALVNSPRVAAARGLLGIQKALYVAATQMPNPIFFRDEAPQSEGVRRVGPIITYEPPWKLAFRLLAAKRQVQETKTEIMQTLWQFRNAVRRSYTDVIITQETYETLHDLSELALRLLNVSSKRFQAGDVPELDVLKARLAHSQALVDTAQGAMKVNRSRQQLNVIMGRQFSTPISAPRLPAFDVKVRKSDLLPDYTIPVPPVTDFIAEALENRIEIKTNDAQIKLTKAQLLNAAGNILPNPNIAFGSSTETNLPSGPKLNGIYTTINAEMPLYNFQQGNLAQLKATLRQFRLQDAAIRNQIIADVTSAYNNLITARNRIQSFQDHVLADSAEVARLARRSYEVGQSDITATLAAQQANVQVRQNYLDAVSNYQQALTDLEQSIGEPID
ncbi:MAG: TolC family protein [Candidatus Obscuribacterales bacterium]|nr:TolC family protein [Candidatus Obscuribacterales bacterium]